MSSEVSEGFCWDSDLESAAVDLTSVGGVSVSLATGVLEGVWPVALDVTWVALRALSGEILSSWGGVWGWK